MKKIIALLLSFVMLLSLASCSMTEKNEDKDDGLLTDEKDDEKKENKDDKEDEKDKEEEKNDGKTVGQTLLAEFEKDHSGTAQEIAERIVGNKIIPFQGGAVPVEEGFLNGFDNADITGFREGATFGPMMSSIPFIGYIFQLDEDTDVEEFKKHLKEKANLRWNLCVEAEELIVENKDKKVFFLMCPKDFEDSDAGLGTEDLPDIKEDILD